MCTGKNFFTINITNKIGFLINFHAFFFHFLNIQELRLKEQEELELAIALSLDQAEQNKTKSSPKSSPEHSSKNTNERSVEQEDDTPQLPTLNSDENSDLQKYLDRSYWEQRNKTAENDNPSPSPASPTGERNNAENQKPIESKSEVKMRP